MGSASFSGGFGKRVPNNPSFQTTRGRASRQQTNTFQGAADLGRSTPMAAAPAISGSEENSHFGLSSEVAASFYESVSGGSSFGSRGINGYAGFWIRVLAYIIDTLFLAFMYFVVIKIAAAVGLYTAYQPMMTPITQELSPEFQQETLNNLMITYGISGLITLFYFVVMESSPLQGTLGKLALGLRVGDMNGNRIGFGRALCRYLAKFISGIILFIGYVMAGFTDKKQGLHDMICSTYVVK